MRLNVHCLSVFDVTILPFISGNLRCETWRHADMFYKLKERFFFCYKLVIYIIAFLTFPVWFNFHSLLIEVHVCIFNHAYEKSPKKSKFKENGSTWEKS